MAKFSFSTHLIEWFCKHFFFEFEWDKGNMFKNVDKHGIECKQAESVFFNKSFVRIIGVQISPIVQEERFGLYGITQEKLPVFVSFTLRHQKIRIISIRKQNSKEKAIYEELCKE